MLRVTGLLMILVGSAGLGFAKSRELSRRLQTLEQILQFVLLLKGEIRYGNTSLPDAFLLVGKKLPEELRGFLTELAADMQRRTGESLGEMFRRRGAAYPAFRCLEEEERARFFSLGDHLGYLDGEMQLAQLSLYEGELKTAVEGLREELPGKKKLFRSIGIFGGIFLVILVF